MMSNMVWIHTRCPWTGGVVAISWDGKELGCSPAQTEEEMGADRYARTQLWCAGVEMQYREGRDYPIEDVLRAAGVLASSGLGRDDVESLLGDEIVIPPEGEASL